VIGARARQALPWFGVAAVVIVLDRITKTLVLQSVAPGETVVLGSFLNLVLVFNKGAAFSFLAGASGWQSGFFAAVAAIASVVITVLIVRHPANRLLAAGLALILGGALGNLWDRLAWGQVVDFVDVHAAGWHWPAFNVADSGITIGAALLILESSLRRDAGR